ncbi:M6 family metalloprotease domain-containing protein [Fibrobacter intestinalis]|uniref:M6 family metalloprotease domain-containing protein n=1 Tax=Fibrobacter intestinalis TaxID=28122 RepID=A0A1M6S5C9_9BACT|nr:M6 family metalloprotease domain-containing protein [Fibrobacter intestinalis]SHK39890.1 M6 family metalloprotease domain-containing protein [Fibrobacter intestinalis]
MDGFWNKLRPAFFAGLLAPGLWAVPMDPTPFTIDNAGDSLTLREVGDEHYSYTHTLDGYIVIRGEDGVYRYAAEDGTEGKFRAKNADLRSDAEKAYLKGLDKDKVQKAHFERNPDRILYPDDERVERAPWVPTVDTSSSAEMPQRLPPASGHVKGTNRFPVLLVESPDMANCDSAAFYALTNAEGFSERGHIGSIRDYFISQSDGAFVPTFDVYPVQVGNSLSSYAQKEGRLIKEAVESLRSKFPNFDAKKYDADGDGEIDAVAVMYAGTKSAANKLGGFAYKLEYYNSLNDGVGRLDAGNGEYFNRYFVLWQMDSQTKMSPIAPFIHEFSHTMGLKDHYCAHSTKCNTDDYTDSVYQAPGAHAWDVMGSGMYNGPALGATPVGYSAFEKAFMGWISYKPFDNSSAVSVLTPFNTTNVAYKIPVEGKDDEWFILENRQRTGWDAYLPHHGMLIWHIDYNERAWKQDTLNNFSAHQRVDVVEAGNLKINSYSDGFYYSTAKANLMDDPFPGSQNVTAFSFTAWDGNSLGVNLYNIREESDGIVCFATREGISITACPDESSLASSSSVAESSSSSIAVSSSSSESSSSSGFVESSSSQGEFLSSSSATMAVVQVQSMGHSVKLFGTTLSVQSGFSGRKMVRAYDLSGKEVLRKTFDDFSADIDLREMSGQVLIVKLSAQGRTLELKRIAVN